jgi:hypothetical protein
MLSTARAILIALTALGLAPAAGAEAAANPNAPIKHTFRATFEAERTVAWERPRTVAAGDCNGDYWSQSNGSDNQKVKSRGSFKVVVAGSRRFPTWTFGRGGMVADPRDMGIDAAGPHKREWNLSSGRTGGWCGAAKTNPPPENDCGTQLPSTRSTSSALAGRSTGAWATRTSRARSSASSSAR